MVAIEWALADPQGISQKLWVVMSRISAICNDVLCLTGYDGGKSISLSKIMGSGIFNVLGKFQEASKVPA